MSSRVWFAARLTSSARAMRAAILALSGKDTSTSEGIHGTTKSESIIDKTTSECIINRTSSEGIMCTAKSEGMIYL